MREITRRGPKLFHQPEFEGKAGEGNFVMFCIYGQKFPNLTSHEHVFRLRFMVFWDKSLGGWRNRTAGLSDPYPRPMERDFFAGAQRRIIPLDQTPK
jgi:hypothetical protein